MPLSPVPIQEDLFDAAAPETQRAKARRPWTQWFVDLLAAVTTLVNDVVDVAADVLTLQGQVATLTTDLNTLEAAAVTRANTAHLTSQSTSLGPTTLTTAPATGFYQVSLTALVAQAATTSSSLILTWTWTSDGVSASVVTAAMTTNTVGAVATLNRLIYADSGTPIQYTVTYASVGGTPMLFHLAGAVEILPT